MVGMIATPENMVLALEDNIDLTAEERAIEQEILSEQDNSLQNDEDEEGSEKDPEGVSSESETITVYDLKLKSFNPGYSDIGEYLELSLVADKNNPISLAGLSVIYTTSSGKEYTVFDFPEGYEMVGESLLMRLQSSNEVMEADDSHEVADLVYTRNMAQTKGQIRLAFEEKTIDLLCWGLEGDDCFPGFNSKKPTVLVRDFSAEEVEEAFKHVPVADYMPKYDPLSPGLFVFELPEEKIEPKCREIEFSEILTYFENSRNEQFIELYNRGDEIVELLGCNLRYKNKLYRLSGKVNAKSLRVFYPDSEWGLQLTKNPTSMNLIEIVDVDGEIDDSLSYSTGQRKGVSLAMIGYLGDGRENWVQTYHVTPGRENVYQQYKTCPADKRLNLETGNCVSEVNLSTTLAACPEGKYRNPLTGRCKSYATTVSAELKPCAEGYERNPATGRCRKIAKNDGAEFPITEDEFEEKREFVALWAIIVVIITGTAYIIYQYKDEIKTKLGR